MQNQPDSIAATVNLNSVEAEAGGLCDGGVEVALSHSVMLARCHRCQQHYWSCGSVLPRGVLFTEIFRGLAETKV